MDYTFIFRGGPLDGTALHGNEEDDIDSINYDAHRAYHEAREGRFGVQFEVLNAFPPEGMPHPLHVYETVGVRFIKNARMAIDTKHIRSGPLRQYRLFFTPAVESCNHYKTARIIVGPPFVQSTESDPQRPEESILSSDAMIVICGAFGAYREKMLRDIGIAEQAGVPIIAIVVSGECCPEELSGRLGRTVEASSNAVRSAIHQICGR